MKIAIFLIKAVILLAALANCNYSCLANDSPTDFLSQESIASRSVRVKILTILAREERRLPSGATPDPNRDIGFASVFLRIENTKEENATVIVKNIEIRNRSDGGLQMASQFPQTIYLKPLENSENVFHLTNKTGYLGKDRVKALVTYQIGERVYILESDPVEVERL